jgi:hypothetical protein
MKMRLIDVEAFNSGSSHKTLKKPSHERIEDEEWETSRQLAIKVARIGFFKSATLIRRLTFAGLLVSMKKEVPSNLKKGVAGR